MYVMVTVLFSSTIHSPIFNDVFGFSYFFYLFPYKKIQYILKKMRRQRISTFQPHSRIFSSIQVRKQMLKKKEPVIFQKHKLEPRGNQCQDGCLDNDYIQSLLYIRKRYVQLCDT